MSEPKTIVLTGVSRGLGRALAAEFIDDGHQVIGCSRSRDRVEALREELPAGDFSIVDVSSDEQVKLWAASVGERFGSPDLLLNNAAVINQNAPLWEVPLDEFDQLVDINIKGVFHVLRHFVPLMAAKASGVIVNFSSGWGRSTSPDVAPYCATKWAIEGMTRALAQELPYGMAAVPLNPGVIHTAMLETCFGSSASAYPSPQQWAKAAAPFLLDLSYADNGDPLTAPS